MKRIIRNVLRGETGAVTVDWVVLTAAVVGLAGAVVLSIQGGTASVGTGVQSTLSGIDVPAPLN